MPIKKRFLLLASGRERSNGNGVFAAAGRVSRRSRHDGAKDGCRRGLKAHVSIYWGRHFSQMPVLLGYRQGFHQRAAVSVDFCPNPTATVAAVRKHLGGHTAVCARPCTGIGL